MYEIISRVENIKRRQSVQLTPAQVVLFPFLNQNLSKKKTSAIRTRNAITEPTEAQRILQENALVLEPIV